MKTLPLVLTFALTGIAQAQTPTDPSSLNNIVRVYDSCGYCGNNDNYFTSCVISRDGSVTLERERTKKGVSTHSKIKYSISESVVEDLVGKVEEARGAKMVGLAKTYSGDASSFGIQGYPESPLHFQVARYADGREVRESESARLLARQAARICGLGGRQMLWNHLLSKIGM